MDPVTALGVAAAIVQLASCAGNVIKVTHEIYKSPTALTKQNEKVLEMSQEMDNLSTVLQSRLQAANEPPESLDPNTQAVLRTAKTCQQRADLLQTALNDVKANQSKHRVFSLLNGSRKSILKKSKIQDLAKDLKDSQQLLDSAMLTSILQRVSAADARQRQTLETFDFSILEPLFDSKPVEEALQNLQAQLADAKSMSAKENEQTRKLITNQHEEFLRSERYQRWLDSILESLSFGSMNEREERVSDAYEGTYEWIFKDAKDSMHEPNPTRSSFNPWLETGSGIFWISGKPGSGKSTLMRWIADDNASKVRDSMARSSTCNSEPIILRYFFWRNGHPDQRSLNGCCRSLLKQVLTRQRELGKYLECFEAMDIPPWHTSRLSREISTLLVTILRLSPVCIFLDGLDECAVNDQIDLVELVTRLSHISTLKLCVSSRPENRFQCSFVGKPTLRLQDLNSNDIRKMIHGKLEGQCPAEFENTEYDRFCWEIAAKFCRKSEGVFLWAYIAINVVLDALVNGKDLNAILRRADTMEDTLEGLFVQILRERTQGDEQTAKWLRILWLRARVCRQYKYMDRPLSLWMFFLLESDPDLIKQLQSLRSPGGNNRTYGVYRSVHKKVEQRSNLLSKQITSQCGGLLNVFDPPSPAQLDFDLPYVFDASTALHIRGIRVLYWKLNSTTVDWIHRSAADFVANNDCVQTIFKSSGYGAQDAAIDMFSTNLRALALHKDVPTVPDSFRKDTTVKERCFMITSMACYFKQTSAARVDATSDVAVRMSKDVVEQINESSHFERLPFDFDPWFKPRHIPSELSEAMKQRFIMQWFDELARHDCLHVAVGHLDSLPETQKKYWTTKLLMQFTMTRELRVNFKNWLFQEHLKSGLEESSTTLLGLPFAHPSNNRTVNHPTLMFNLIGSPPDGGWIGHGLAQPGVKLDLWNMQMMQFLYFSLDFNAIKSFEFEHVLRVLNFSKKYELDMDASARVCMRYDAYHLALDISYGMILEMMDLQYGRKGLETHLRKSFAGQCSKNDLSVRAVRIACSRCFFGAPWIHLEPEVGRSLSGLINADFRSVELRMALDTCYRVRPGKRLYELRQALKDLCSSQNADVCACRRDGMGLISTSRTMSPAKLHNRISGTGGFIRREPLSDPNSRGRPWTIWYGETALFFGPATEGTLSRRYSCVEMRQSNGRHHIEANVAYHEEITYQQTLRNPVSYGSDDYENIFYRPSTSDQPWYVERLSERQRFVIEWPDVLFWRGGKKEVESSTPCREEGRKIFFVFNPRTMPIWQACDWDTLRKSRWS